MKLLEFPEKNDTALLLKAFADIAKMSRTYYLELIEQGFTEQQALDIVKALKWW